jgi:hypothetical protein
MDIFRREWGMEGVGGGGYPSHALKLMYSVICKKNRVDKCVLRQNDF